ncbi:MAG: sugar phosphate isomerase/epimerase [Clostridiales bacterium]|nr:sugar phosphate isomerase/epimerase [Clostridiales bacterium]
MLPGAQTYTIRAHTQTREDFARSMKKLAAMGYTCVQLSAVGEMPVRYLKDVCDEAGLAIVLTHTDPERMLTDPQGVLRDHEVLDCPYIGIGMMPSRYRSPEAALQFARDFRQAAELFHQGGKRLLYHHHALEWERGGDGRSILDILLDELPPHLLGVTLDTYWVQAAGADVCDTILRLAQRIPCVHLKDMAIVDGEQRTAALGEGNLPLRKILRLLQDLGATRYLLVEQDNSYGEDPFDCLSRSLTYLHKEGFQ